MQQSKYQVFISSTYEDLRDCRAKLAEATLRLGHIPIGMEMFNAGNDAQWKVIKRQIDQSDYYAVIIAHRYGSTLKGKSYTEMEYDYAVRQGVPVMGFIIDEKVPVPPSQIELDAKVPLEKFKSKVKQKIVKQWTSPDDLAIAYVQALNEQIQLNPRPGWNRNLSGTLGAPSNFTGRWNVELPLRIWRGYKVGKGEFVRVTGCLDLVVGADGAGQGVVYGTLEASINTKEGKPYSAEIRVVDLVTEVAFSEHGLSFQSETFNRERIDNYDRSIQPPDVQGLETRFPPPRVFKWELKQSARNPLLFTGEYHCRKDGFTWCLGEPVTIRKRVGELA